MAGHLRAIEQAVAAALPPIGLQVRRSSSQRGTFILARRRQAPLGPSIVWNDGRALKYQEIFAKEISPADNQTHTGMQL